MRPLCVYLSSRTITIHFHCDLWIIIINGIVRMSRWSNQNVWNSLNTRHNLTLFRIELNMVEETKTESDSNCTVFVRHKLFSFFCLVVVMSMSSWSSAVAAADATATKATFVARHASQCLIWTHAHTYYSDQSVSQSHTLTAVHSYHDMTKHLKIVNTAQYTPIVVSAIKRFHIFFSLSFVRSLFFVRATFI